MYIYMIIYVYIHISACVCVSNVLSSSITASIYVMLLGAGSSAFSAFVCKDFDTLFGDAPIIGGEQVVTLDPRDSMTTRRHLWM